MGLHLLVTTNWTTCFQIWIKITHVNLKPYSPVSGWPFFQTIFPGLQWKSVSNFYTWHYKTQFLTKLALFWCLYLSKFVKIPIKNKKFVLVFKNSGLWKIIPGFRDSCNFSRPARKIRGTGHPAVFRSGSCLVLTMMLNSMDNLIYLIP